MFLQLIFCFIISNIFLTLLLLSSVIVLHSSKLGLKQKQFWYFSTFCIFGSTKGEKRPINDIEERTSILSLFDFIDYIIVFNDDTPYKIIDLLRPNIIVKGSDYEKTNVVGANLVDDVILFDYISNKSTSLIINKIIK